MSDPDIILATILAYTGKWVTITYSVEWWTTASKTVCCFISGVEKNGTVYYIIKPPGGKAKRHRLYISNAFNLISIEEIVS